MNFAHPLLVRAQTYPRPNRDLAPSGCSYDRLKGAWIDCSTGTLAVELSWRPRPQTKKADVETGGEDQKGE